MSKEKVSKIVSASVSDRGLSEKRPENEDSFIAIDEYGIYAVADGVGGAQAGEVASQMAVEILGEAFINRTSRSDPAEVLASAIERANSAIFQMAQDLPQLASMATTIAAVHLQNGSATIGHVGDSRVYRVDQDGSLVRETDDHSMVAEEVRAGRMTEAQAETHPSRNIISRALGADPGVAVDLKTIPIDDGTRLLLCSDGITRHVSDEEISEILGSGTEPEEICDRLKRLCFDRGAGDNLTAIVIAVGDRNSGPGPDNGNLDDSDEDTVATARAVTEGTPAGGHAEIVDAPNAPHGDQSLFFDGSARAGGLADTGGPTLTYSEQPSPFGKLAGMAALLVFGAALGAGVYHFSFTGKEMPAGPILTEMKSGNQALSAFEDNRRLVDQAPAEALARFGADPRDAEDHFLLGRANLLLARYDEARQAFTLSKSKIAMGEVDPNNAKTIETEIAIGLAVINDVAVRTILETQLTNRLSTPTSPNR